MPDSSIGYRALEMKASMVRMTACWSRLESLSIKLVGYLAAVSRKLEEPLAILI